MTTTQNLHLPQWEADDRIMRTDFNDAMASIDTGVRAAIDTAVAGAAKIAYGSYVGDGGTSRTIVFPFPPKLIIMQHAASDQWLAINLLLRDSGKWNVLDFYGNRVTNYTADYTIDGCTLTIQGSTSAEGMDGADFRYDYLVIG